MTAGTPPASKKSSIRNEPDGFRLTSHGVARPIASNTSRSKASPARPAIALRWTTALVEPPRAWRTVIAFLIEASLSTSVGRGPALARSTAARPAVSAIRAWRASAAGIAAAPGNVKPSVSASEAIVDAVPMVEQWPAERTMTSSRRRWSARVDVPARTVSDVRQQSVHVPTSCPSNLALSCGPPGTMIAGRSALIAPMSIAGIVLSQPASRTTLSIG